jgi:heme/copper-type cytochrome/quinol oxidase subunit 4
MTTSSENLIKKGDKGEGTVIQESEVKQLVDENISGYVDGKFKELEQRFETKIENKETKTTEILAIFITLFTFISVNVNIFTKVSDVYTAIWFMLLMTTCSILLLSFLFLVIKSKNDWKLWLGLIITLAFVAFLILITISTKWNPKLNEVKMETQVVKVAK